MCPAAAPAIRRALRLHPLPAGGAIFQGTEISLPGSPSLFFFFLRQIPAEGPRWTKPGELRLDASLLQRISWVPQKMLVQCNECFLQGAC